MECCDNCRFFDSLKTKWADGHCRRYPPAVVYLRKTETYDTMIQPHVGADQWCGEWQPTPPADDASTPRTG